MKTGCRFGLAVFLVLLGCRAGFATPISNAPATYYISASSGDDNNDGQSPAHAWQHLWKIYDKSASKDPFRPGDSIRLKRGDQWDGQIRLQATGTAQEPITIGAYGQGAKPLIYGDNQEARWESVAGHPGIYTTDLGEGSIPGSIFLDGKNLTTIYPIGAFNRIENTEMFLGRLLFGTSVGRYGSRLWIRMTDSKPPSEALRMFRAAGVSLANSSYVQIEDLDIERFNTGIDISNSEHVLVQHNDIQDVLGIGIYLRSADANCQVESNTVFRSGNTALYVLKGSGNKFRDNWVSHVDTSILGIHVSGDGMGVGLQESRQSLVEYNYFSHSGGMDFYFEQGSTVRYNYLYRVRSAGAPHGVNLNVYGNIYNLGGDSGKPGSTGVNAVATGPGSIAVFNNTIFNASGFFLMGSSDKGGKIVFSDNIASSSAPGTAMTVFGANVASNHNCFSTLGQPIFRYNGATFPALTKYQAASGLDRNSIFSDPQFFSSAPFTPLDFRLNPSSGCNSPALNIPLADLAEGRTYDHDVTGNSVIGALRAAKPDNPATAPETCKSHCFQHPFAVANGVYLVRLKFAPSVQSRPKQEVGFVLNGRKVAAQFDLTEIVDPADTLFRSFLVRPDGATITLDPDPTSDISLITEVDIVPFDTSHGKGSQVIPW
ncbi:MAG: right-handed parallel beta-helix repeat-containing protein [Terriglobales bacterium]